MQNENKICDQCSGCTSNNKETVLKALALFLIVMSIFMVFKTIGSYKSNKYIGQGGVENTISFSGEGEIFAPADVANFSFSVVEEAKTPDEAQSLATAKMNKAIKFLRDSNILDKDIKTTGYNIYPRYEWMPKATCSSSNCPTERVLVGYEASQNVSVKVRDIQKAGEVLSGVGSLNVTNISGLDFVIDDEDALKREARKLAIDDAKNKAKTLSKDLGIDLVRIVNFSESGAYPIYMRASLEADMLGKGVGGAETPEILVGENKITSNITITYEIR